MNFHMQFKIKNKKVWTQYYVSLVVKKVFRYLLIPYHLIVKLYFAII